MVIQFLLRSGKIPLFFSCRKSTVLCIMLFLSQSILYSQNLIRNSGFESYSNCPSYYGDFNGFVNEWYTFFGTPDYHNSCGFESNWISASSGNGYSVLAIHFGGDLGFKREYIHTQLKKNLIEDSLYVIVADVAVFEESPFIYPQYFSLLFSDTVVNAVPPDSLNRLNYIPSVNLDLPPEILNNSYETLIWCFKANSNSEFLTIGLFDEISDVLSDSLINEVAGAHIALDNFKIYPLNQLMKEDTFICINDSLNYSDPYDLGWVWVHDNDTIRNSWFPEEAGIHEIDIYLPNCSYLGSFRVEVKSCESCYEGMYDKKICTGDTIYFQDFLPTPLYASDSTFVGKCTGENLFEVFHPNCPDPVDSMIVFVDHLNACINMVVHDSLCLENTSSLPELPYPLYYISSGSGTMELESKEGLFSFEIGSFFCEEFSSTVSYLLKRCSSFDLFIPNIFTPNGDDINDHFTIISSNLNLISLQVFDRWGGLLFEDRSPPLSWSGKGKISNEMPVGVYVYKLEYIRPNGEIATEYGDVTLLR